MRPPQQTQQIGGPPPAQMGAPAQTQMGGPMAPPPPGRPNLPPGAFQVAPKQKSTAGIVIAVIALVCVVLGVMVFAVTKSGMFKGKAKPTEPADKVMLAFLQVKRTEDLAKCEPYLSQHSIKMIQNTLSSKQAQSAGFTRKDAADTVIWSLPPTREDMNGKEITASVLKTDRDASDSVAIVQVTCDEKQEAPVAQPLLPPGQEPPQQPEKHDNFGMSMRLGRVSVTYVLIAEDGKWKVDIDNTNRRALGLGPRTSLFGISN